MIRCCWTVLIAAVALAGSARASLVTHFNFNDYDGDSSTINADSGGGVITLESGGGAWPSAELDNPTGTTLNAVGTDPAGTALALGNNGSSAVVRTLTIQLSTLGFANLVLSFASAGSNSTFSDAEVSYSYSINGTDFVDTGISFDPATQGSFATVTQDLSSVTALQNQPNVLLRLTLSGSNLNANQELLIDNLQINGTAVAEAHAVAMMLVAALLFGAVGQRRRRLRASS